MRAASFIVLILISIQGVFGLTDIPIPQRRPTFVNSIPLNAVLMDSVSYRSNLEEVEDGSESYRYQILGTFWKKTYFTYIWDKVRNTIRVSNRRKWKTIIDLRERVLRGFGLTKNGKLIILTSSINHDEPKDFTLGIHRTNGQRETHLDFSAYIEHNNLTALELDFPNFYLLQGDFTTQVDTLGKNKRIFLGEPLYGDEESEKLSVHVSLAGDHMVIDLQERVEGPTTKKTSNTYSFTKEELIDHVITTHRFNSQVKVVLEGEMTDEFMARYYELHFDQKKDKWLSNKSILLEWKEPELRQFWYYNNKIYMTEIKGHEINTYRFK